MTGAQIERERAKKRLQEQARLGREDYEAWKEKLQQLDLSRQKIKEAMGFAFDKIESAEEVSTGVHSSDVSSMVIQIGVLSGVSSTLLNGFTLFTIRTGCVHSNLLTCFVLYMLYLVHPHRWWAC
jgi:hypothetical protein